MSAALFLPEKLPRISRSLLRWNKTFSYRVLATSGSAMSMSPPVSAEATAEDCICVVNLQARAKSLMVQLVWDPVPGATCYNVYRSTSPGVALIPANKVATCIGSATPVYTDTKVVNGTTYYYKVVEVIGSEETCKSDEVHATPARPPR